MGEGRIVTKDKVKPSDRKTHWVEVNGSPVDDVPLKKSREVALEPISRRNRRSGVTGERHKVRSARENPETHGISESGIQIYRLWFQFLKLALELEDLGVTTLVTQQGRIRKDLGSTERQNYERTGSMYQLKDTILFKIKEEKYEGWDLPQVLSDPFNKWWKSHFYLFEGHSPAFMKQGDNLDPDFLYIRIDPTSKLEDVRDFVTREVQSQITGEPRFAVTGYPRPDVIQNRYNALVLKLKGWSAQEICTGGAKERIYLRATDTRSKDDRLMVSSAYDKTKKRTVIQWSATVRKQTLGGVHHLQEVMKGQFGGVPTKGIK